MSEDQENNSVTINQSHQQLLSTPVTNKTINSNQILNETPNGGVLKFDIFSPQKASHTNNNTNSTNKSKKKTKLLTESQVSYSSSSTTSSSFSSSFSSSMPSSPSLSFSSPLKKGKPPVIKELNGSQFPNNTGLPFCPTHHPNPNYNNPVAQAAKKRAAEKKEKEKEKELLDYESPVKKRAIASRDAWNQTSPVREEPQQPQLEEKKNDLESLLQIELLRRIADKEEADGRLENVEWQLASLTSEKSGDQQEIREKFENEAELLRQSIRDLKSTIKSLLKFIKSQKFSLRLQHDFQLDSDDEAEEKKEVAPIPPVPQQIDEQIQTEREKEKDEIKEERTKLLQLSRDKELLIEELKQQLISQKISQMKLPIKVAKYNFHNQKRSVRYITLSEDGKQLVWSKTADMTKPSNLNLSEVTEVLHGAHTLTLQNRSSDDAGLMCLSLVLATRTVDLVFHKQRELDLWLEGISILCRNISIQTNTTTK